MHAQEYQVGNAPHLLMAGTPVSTLPPGAFLFLGASFRGCSGCRAAVLLFSKVGQPSAFQAPHLRAARPMLSKPSWRVAPELSNPTIASGLSHLVQSCHACQSKQSTEASSSGMRSQEDKDLHGGGYAQQESCHRAALAGHRQAHLFSRFRMLRMAAANCLPYLGRPSSSAYSCPSSSSASTTYATPLSGQHAPYNELVQMPS